MAGLDIAAPPPSDTEVWAPSSLPGPWAQRASTCVRVELELSLGAGGWVVVALLLLFPLHGMLILKSYLTHKYFHSLPILQGPRTIPSSG